MLVMEMLSSSSRKSTPKLPKISIESQLVPRSLARIPEPTGMSTHVGPVDSGCEKVSPRTSNELPASVSNLMPET